MLLLISARVIVGEWEGILTLSDSHLKGRGGSVQMSRAMTDYSDFITDMKLMDLPLLGGCFTWSNDLSMSRIECVALTNHT